MKLKTICVSMALFFFSLAPSFAADHYTDGLIYGELYGLSLDLQARLYRLYYLDRQLDQSYPDVLYFYARAMEMSHKKSEALEYYRKFQRSSSGKLPKELGAIGEITVQEQGKALWEKLSRIEQNSPIVCSTLLLVADGGGKTVQERLFKKLSGGKKQEDYEEELRQTALAIYQFRVCPTEESAKAVLSLAVPCVRFDRNFFYDACVYREMERASFFMASLQEKETVSKVDILLRLGEAKLARQSFEARRSSLLPWQQECLALRMESALQEETIWERVSQFQEKFDTPEASLSMAETLLSMGQKEIARTLLGSFKENSRERRIWQLYYRLGDAEMRENLRTTVSNWWGPVIEEEPPLEMVRLSRYLLGDHFIYNDVRRLLSENNPFHPKSKLMKDYSSSIVLAMCMKRYIGGGRK